MKTKHGAKTGCVFRAATEKHAGEMRKFRRELSKALGYQVTEANYDNAVKDLEQRRRQSERRWVEYCERQVAQYKVKVVAG